MLLTSRMIEEQRSLGLQKLASWKDLLEICQLAVNLLCALKKDLICMKVEQYCHNILGKFRYDVLKLMRQVSNPFLLPSRVEVQIPLQYY